jgi:type IV secretion system protein TrbL
MPGCDSGFGQLSPGCLVQGAVSSVATSTFDNIAQKAGESAGEMVVKALTWWVSTPSIDPNTPTVEKLQGYLLPIVVAILTMSVLAQAVRVVLSRTGSALVETGTGLVRYTVTVGVATGLVGGALSAGDALAGYFTDTAAQDFGKKMAALMTAAVISNPFTLLIVALLLLIIAAVQWVVGLFRQAGILVLVVLLPLAAAGSVGRSTRSWLPRLGTLLLALVVYKPMVGFIYLIGFELVGTGTDFTTALTGIMVLGMAVFALPLLLSFFSWADLGGSGGGGAGLALAVGAGSAALTMSGGGGSSSGGSSSGGSPAVQQASFLDATGPGSGGGGQGGPSGAMSQPTGGPTGISPAGGGGEAGAAAALSGAEGGASAASAGAGAGAGAVAGAAGGPWGMAAMAAAQAVGGAASHEVHDMTTPQGGQPNSGQPSGGPSGAEPAPAGDEEQLR